MLTGRKKAAIRNAAIGTALLSVLAAWSLVPFALGWLEAHRPQAFFGVIVAACAFKAAFWAWVLWPRRNA